jgi:hypothetical protein
MNSFYKFHYNPTPIQLECTCFGIMIPQFSCDSSSNTLKKKQALKMPETHL